ncbi:MAG: sodium ion-translocating decarboxylase subunit beta [Deltaproteobacteria bacterium]|nr:MAG: sodium ion-translocating decarboxylase subunit beta [Deltaproteobacteria bacterium]
MLDLIVTTGVIHLTIGNLVMWLIAFVFIYLAITKNYEPLLLVPIGFGILVVNLPLTFLMQEGQGLLWKFYHYGLEWEIIPPLIFLGLGALTDFGPMIANPKTLILGAGAQFGVYVSFFGALFLGFNIPEACSIGIIGGADGPTTIYTTVHLAPHLLGATAVAAYSYMSLVPIIQPPIMRLLTTESERKIKMRQLRPVSKREKILFPLVTVLVICLIVPASAPLMAMFMLGNLFKECGVVKRLSDAAANELMNIVTILLGISVGATMSAENFLKPQVIFVFLMGLVAFAFSTAAGIMLAKLINLFSKEKINPLIGSAGVSAVPMAARVSQIVGAKADPKNFLLMHAMGPNVAGVIGTVVAAGVFLALAG